MHLFDDMPNLPTGRELIDPDKVLLAGGVTEGIVVADFGCGTLGHYIFPAAHMVGATGKVYAVDILKSVLESIESRIKLEAVGNVVVVRGDLEREHGVPLADGIIDVGLLVNNLFMTKQLDALISECARMLKPGGTMVIVDWKTAGSAFGPDPASRVDPEAAKRHAVAAGLTLAKEFSPGKYHYGFVFRKAQ
jgi:ubiquinone/menaquinone biosynthesis C-methylase UbiE